MKMIWKIIIIASFVVIPVITCVIIPVDKIIQWLWITPFREIRMIWVGNNTVDWQDLFHTFFPLRGFLNVIFLFLGIVFLILYFQTAKEHYWMKIVGIVGLFPIVVPFVYLLILLLFGFLSVLLEMIKLLLRILLPLGYLIGGLFVIKNVIQD